MACEAVWVQVRQLLQRHPQLEYRAFSGVQWKGKNVVFACRGLQLY
jgi:hypothetical protein